MDRSWTSRRDHGGAAVVVLAVAVVVGVLFAIAVGEFGARLIDRTQAQVAADAVALGSLDGGRAVAVRLAAENGAELVSWRRGPGPFEVTVVVRIGDSTARARASDAP